MKPIFERMKRVAMLEQSVFEEIVADPSIQGQSVWVVAIFAMTTAFGTFMMAGGAAVNVGLLTTMIFWYVWAFSVFYFGSHLLGTMQSGANRKTVLRVMAFACAPGAIRILGVVPKAAGIVFVITTVWILIAAVMGLKKVFVQSSTGKIVAICITTWVGAAVFQAILMVTLLSVFGVSKPG